MDTNTEVEEARKARKDATDKLYQLQTQRTEAEQRIQEIDGLTRGREENPIKKAAQAMLNGEDISPMHLAPLFEEAADLRRKVRIIGEALDIQRRVLGEAETKLARVIGKARLPEYKAILRKHVRCLLALSLSTEESIRFQDDFRQDGLSFSCAIGNVSHFSKVGTLSDKDSRISFYLRELVRDGWLTPAELETLKAEATRAA